MNIQRSIFLFRDSSIDIANSLRSISRVRSRSLKGQTAPFLARLLIKSMLPFDAAISSADALCKSPLDRNVRSVGIFANERANRRILEVSTLL